MVRGINTFTAYFKDYADKYIIIGGTALDILTEDVKKEAVAIIENQLPDKSIFKHMGVNVQTQQVFNQFKQIFKLS